MDYNTDEQESLNNAEQEETSQNDTSSEVEDRLSKLEAEISKQKEIAENQRIRAEKAEAKAKAKAKKDEPTDNKHDYPDVDERILRANGMPDELLKELKAIAKARDVDLINAQNDSLFKLVKENYEKEQKMNEASVGASRGSGNAHAKKSANTPGLSRDEHKKFFQNLN